jgi:hypothetical protein
MKIGFQDATHRLHWSNRRQDISTYGNNMSMCDDVRGEMMLFCPRDLQCCDVTVIAVPDATSAAWRAAGSWKFSRIGAPWESPRYGAATGATTGTPPRIHASHLRKNHLIEILRLYVITMLAKPPASSAESNVVMYGVS